MKTDGSDRDGGHDVGSKSRREERSRYVMVQTLSFGIYTGGAPAFVPDELTDEYTDEYNDECTGREFLFRFFFFFFRSRRRTCFFGWMDGAVALFP
jgi:hypothetical protein